MKNSFQVRDLLGLVILMLIAQAKVSGQQCPSNGGDPIKPASITFKSLQGTAILCGFTDYTNPVVPTKKYRTQSISGRILDCNFTAPVCGTVLSTGTAGGIEFQGTYHYSKTNCSESNTQIRIVTADQGLGCSFPSTLIAIQPVGRNPRNIDFLSYQGWAHNIETVTPTKQITRPGGECFEFFGSYIKTTSTVVMELSDEDTQDDAAARAVLTEGNSNTAYRLSLAGDYTFAFRKVHYEAVFDTACPGEYEAVVSYAVKIHGSATVADHETQVVRATLDPGTHSLSGDIRVSQPDMDYTLESIEIRKLCDKSSPGAADFKMSSVHAELSLGLGTRQESSGFLSLKSDTIASAIYAPGALRVGTADSGVETIRDGASGLRQVKAPQTLADIVTLSASSYEVRFYALADVGAQDSGTRIYAVSGTPFVTYKFENPDSNQTTRLRITEARGSNVRIAEYAYDAGTSSWTLSNGGGLRQETLVTTVVGGDTVKTITIRDASSAVVSKTKKAYHTYGWGDELVSEVLDPDGAALATTYEFYGNSGSDGDNYSHLKQRTNPDGSWERHTWNATGQPLKTITPFGDAASTAADNLCRVTESTYSTLADADGDGVVEQLATTIESTLGQETGRSYRVDWSKTVALGSDICQRRSSIRCVAAGAAWNASANLVTETLLHTVDPFSGRERRVVRPDGTATLSAYSVDSGGVLITTIKTGQPNGTFDDFVSGTRTVTFTSAQGQLTSRSVTDIASGLTLSAWTATQFDSLGRPTRLDYPDSTYETRDYACCGLSSSRDRSGLVTSYQYDALGRQTDVTRIGVTSHTTYDADNRVKSVSRIGTDNSNITQATNTYDLAGRLTERRDALSRLTATSEVFDSGTGHLTRTTTNPDASTSIEVRARDGSVVTISGTAVAPRSYEYGVDTDGLFTKTILVGASNATTEWSKTWTDFAGRAYKTVLADNASSMTYFNTIGQMVRQVDPDGVTTLFAYNARGEQETVAIDLNANGTIDYNGTDRISRTVADVTAHSGVNAQRTTTSVWETDGQDTATTVSVSEQGGDGMHSWQTVRGLPTSTVTTVGGSGGRTVTTTAPDGLKTIQVYAGDRLASSTLKTATDVQITATTYGYDAHGRLGSATDARTGTTTYSYFDDDQIHTVTTPDPDTGRSGDGYDPQTTTFAYDGAGRQNQVTQSDGGVVNTTYWPTGAVKRTWGARTYPAEHTYDSQGRVKTLTTWQNFSGDSGQAVTTWNYDSVRGWLNNKRHADNSGPSYTYKPSGRLLTRMWARTPTVTTTYSYNTAGDLSGMTYSDGTPAVSMAYDRAGRPKSMIDAAGTRNLSYHASGQLEDEDYTGGALNGFTLDRSFDSVARLSGLSVGSLYSAGYGYDAASRLDTVTSGANTATYGYVTNSSLVGAVIFQQGGATRLTTTKAYDNLNRLSSVSSAPSAASVLSHGYSYNSANQRTKATRETNAYWNYGYDPLGQVTSGKKFTSADVAMPGHDFAWTYDDSGNRKTAVTNGNTSNYTANNLNQYSAQTVPGVIEVLGEAQPDATVSTTFPATGGAIARTTRQGSLFYQQLSVSNGSVAQNPSLKVTGVKNLVGSNGEDAVTEITRTAYMAQTPEGYGYDADGNLISDARWTYTWDGENRMITMETSAAALAVGVTKQKLEFAYDGQSRRFAKKVYSWSGSAWALASSKLFLYDGWNLLADLNALSSNAVICTYVWGSDLSGSMQSAGGVGGLLFTNSATLSSPLHAACYDGNGNVIGYVDMANGAKSATYEYSAFGETLIADGAAKEVMPFRFSTKYTDDETGQLYYGLRYYNPSAGRWPSRDPIEEEGGMNLYAYVGNNPINAVDPFGLREIFVAVWERTFPYVAGTGSVGHVAVVEKTGVILLSQFPDPHATRGANTPKSYNDTIAFEGKRPDHLFKIFVPDDKAFDAAILDHVKRPWWDWRSDDPDETNCSTSSADSLKKGGVPMDNYVFLISPNDVLDTLTKLSNQQKGPKQKWSVKKSK